MIIKQFRKGVNKMRAYLGMMATVARIKVKKLFTDEKGAVDIVAIVVLIGIAVLLAVLFKDQIGNLIKTLLETITGDAKNTVTEKL